jgi:serine/threonine protein phosphatase PrpC
MGCASSSKVRGVVEASPARRRLTVGIDEEGSSAIIDEDYNAAPEDRSLLLQLDKQQIVDMISAHTDEGDDGTVGRKFSISSQTDKNLNLINSFTSKETTLQGHAVDFTKEFIGYACKKGLKPEAPNQDSFFICKAEGQFSIYGVFDGHGRKGHDISNFVKDHLPKVLVAREEILADPLSALTVAFQRTQKLIEQATNMQAIDANRSGTTASVVLHDHRKKMIHIAHVGDSRVVLAKTDPAAKTDGEKWQAIDLTEDHKPNLPAEKARIEQMGGQVIFDGGYNYRVYAKGKRYPGLNMSRAMGDLVGFYDAGISAMPDVASHHVGKSNENQSGDAEGLIDPCSPKSQNGEAKAAAVMGAFADMHQPSPFNVPDRDEERNDSQGSRTPAASLSSHSIDPISDKFLLICSDGVWEFVNSKEAVDAVSKFRQDQAMEAAEHLATLSWDRWMHYMRGEVVDDITALVVHLGPEAATDIEMCSPSQDE